MADVPSIDVVVVGAGMAGLAAALTAQEAGARVTVLEAADTAGGSAALSAGQITTFGSYTDMRQAIPRGEPDQARVVTETYDEAVRWLDQLGVPLTASASYEFGFPRNHAMQPPQALRHLATTFTRRGGDLQTRVRVIRLLTDERRAVSGVLAQRSLDHQELRARAVILASGGFQGNPELTTRYIGRWADRMLVRANAHSVGDGLLMAQEVGAGASRGLHAFYGHLLPAPPAQIEASHFLPTTAYYSRYAVLVNSRGERFTDESRGDEMNAQAAARQDEAAVFAILDDEIYRRQILGHRSGIDRIAAAREVGGAVATATSLDELIAELATWGVHPGILARTLREYNAAMAEDRGETLAVRRAEHRRPMTEPPFIAVALSPAITFTHGGIRIDGRCRVLDRHGAPVSGLYAAGADAGGTYYERYGGGLAMALTLGRAAGRVAATSH
jgi:succinate dehydrogenase/fumarate reductase flavoprotein subunit